MSSEIKANTISEVTSANGVSIDGLKVKDSALVTDTNKYNALKTGELNSKGFVKNNAFFVNYYIGANTDIADSSWVELGGSASGANMSWTVQPTTGTTGSTNSDPFGKFDTTTGRFTPTISGFYFIDVWLGFSEDLGDGDFLQTVISRNGHETSMNSNLVTYFRERVNANIPHYNFSGTINLDANDYVSVWVWHNFSEARKINVGRFFGLYLGENL